MNLTPRAFAILKSSILSPSPIIARLSPVSRIGPVCISCLVRHRQSSAKSVSVDGRRHSSDASSQRWKARQSSDPYTKAAKAQEMRSRAGFKLLELNLSHNFLGPGMTVVDLGFAPGAWTEVAVNYTRPNGRVVGVDMLPAIPPAGASTFQGNFLDEQVQLSIRRFLSAEDRGRPTEHFMGPHGYFEAERAEESEENGVLKQQQDIGKNTVDLVLSDMLAPWAVYTGNWVNSIKNPFTRLMNVSGLRNRDHVHSMDLCVSALLFCIDVLKPGGSFVCKFYQGPHDKDFEKGLKLAFTAVSREKPDASRPESREAFFVAKKFRGQLVKDEVLEAMPGLQF